MGKETRIGVGVVGVLVVISGALLYGRVTRDTGLPIELNVDSGTAATLNANEVPKQPTIESNTGPYRPTSPVSPAPLRLGAIATPGESYLPDTSGSPVSDDTRQLTIPNNQTRTVTGYRSPVTSPASPAQGDRY